ncbi:MAG: 3-hydroxyanthranilate 3,4-dioxygenase (EC [uncultured Aureispira sp.]|uniref:3-hydroxyanthranilate 3,4-dioxygenase n=1 Tax=uncultured Aureispira sp. TaxID=1331704 RepID=A0A6S6TML5_9BACT|nr:MAG: 3-hydroxyanthranilate 3,4-dioxygenase (EC [uncultured Aureispira sp.]
MKAFNVVNLMKWVEENKDNLKPPVCNKEIFPGSEYIVMVIGGPNLRKDYHYNETPEFFMQLKGDMVLKVIENGLPTEIPIKEGEIFVLPAKVPHSPQRPAGSIGLVIEHVRDVKRHTDGFQWYCENCNAQLHEDYFKLTNIEKQLPEVFGKFNNNEALHKCSNCGEVLQVVKK